MDEYTAKFESLISSLSMQHANSGHIEYNMVKIFIENMKEQYPNESSVKRIDLDVRTIRKMTTLLAYLLIDLKAEAKNGNIIAIDECLILNELLHCYIR
jgi:hypothetical protein